MFGNIREKNTELSIAPLEQVLKAWNRSLEGITNKADKDIVRNLCYEITKRPHENHGTKMKAIGVLARLGKDLWRNGVKIPNIKDSLNYLSKLYENTLVQVNIHDFFICLASSFLENLLSLIVPRYILSSIF